MVTINSNPDTSQKPLHSLSSLGCAETSSNISNNSRVPGLAEGCTFSGVTAEITAGGPAIDAVFEKGGLAGRAKACRMLRLDNNA